MNNESNNTTTKDTLVECAKCGSTDFCLTQELKVSFIWAKCRQCDRTFGLVHKIKHEGE